MPDSSTAAATAKPAKPRPDFPLFPHATRRWAKKIRGKLHYFGPWDDPDGALTKYVTQRDDLFAGRKPRVSSGVETIHKAANRFMKFKEQAVTDGELTQRSWNDYHRSCERVMASMGKERPLDDVTTEDFETLRADLSKTLGPVSLANEIQRIRVFFKYAYDAGVIPAPMRFGPGFKRPSKKTLRLEKAKKGPRMFQAKELALVIQKAPLQLKAMVLLGINAGLGNHDCARLKWSAIDLKTRWMNYPRPKTGVGRRAPLWPETIKALKAIQGKVPMPKEPDDTDLVFVTRCGAPWGSNAEAGSPISAEMGKLLRELKIAREGLNFYALRHTFETIGGNSRDQQAVDLIMGHERDDMATIYRHEIADERLQAVTEHIKKWLWPGGKGGPR